MSGPARLTVWLAAMLFVSACTAPPPPLSAWVELTPGDAAEIRAVTAAAACPAAEIDGKKMAMAERAAPNAAFPVRSCGLSVARSVRTASLGGEPLPLPPARINRIVLFGDTGCRLKGQFVQSCNDPAAWPFALVARQAAARHPDLVIHVGDYHYRETPCPAGNTGCAGTPSGDDWDVWSADFFTPAAPLLKAAPWIMVRGNHELCARAGAGWFRLLDPFVFSGGCADFTPPYAIHLDGLGLAVLDSAQADDSKPLPAQVRQYAEAFESAAAQMREPFWVLTHRPIWGLAPVAGNPSGTAFAPLNRTEQAAVDSEIPANLGMGNLDMVVSGHVHTFATYAFGPSRPAQLVVGVGGSLYDKMHIPAGATIEIDGLMTTNSFALTEYGYLVMDRTAAGWDGVLYNAGDDRVLARCTFKARDVACRAP